MWWRSSALFASLLAGLAAWRWPAAASSPFMAAPRPEAPGSPRSWPGSKSRPIPGRVGQKLRNELIFANTGGGSAGPTRYRLDIVVKESVTDQLVQITGDATGQVYQLDATFKLIDVCQRHGHAPGQGDLARAL